MPAELRLQRHPAQVPAADTNVGSNSKASSAPRASQRAAAEKAGWRYGFVASLEDGSRVYSDTFADAPGTAEFTVPANTKFLWLVVMGAPTEHWIREGRRRRESNDESADEQWPYRIRIDGTTHWVAVTEALNFEKSPPAFRPLNQVATRTCHTHLCVVGSTLPRASVAIPLHVTSCGCITWTTLSDSGRMLAKKIDRVPSVPSKPSENSAHRAER